MPDVNNTDTIKLASLQRQAGTGMVRAQVKDALTGTTVKKFGFAGASALRDAVLLSDVSGNGKTDLLSLVENAAGGYSCRSRTSLPDSL